MKLSPFVFSREQITDSNRKRQHIGIVIARICSVLPGVEHRGRKDRVPEMLPSFHGFQTLQVNCRIRSKPVVDLPRPCLEKAEVARRQLRCGYGYRNGEDKDCEATRHIDALISQAYCYSLTVCSPATPDAGNFSRLRRAWRHICYAFANIWSQRPNLTRLHRDRSDGFGKPASGDGPPGVAVAAVCDVYQPNLERAAALARKSGHQPKETKDFREVLSDRSIDAVCISTPDHWHPYITVEACKAGKDVYVEKPAGVAVDEGYAMVAAARKYNRVVQAGTWQRSGAHFQKACELVRNGTLGKVAMCRTWIYSNQPQQGIGHTPDATTPTGLDWERWLGPAPSRTFSANRFGVFPKAYSYFRYFWDYAGGQLTDSGVHMLDIVQMAFGDPMPASVVALGG